jgi:hypothetical protein
MKSYMAIRDEITILQTTVETIRPDLLDEKLPILVYDKLVNPLSFIQSIFKWRAISTKETSYSSLEIEEKKSAYTCIYSLDSNAIITVNNKVDVILYQYNLLILPRGWTFSSSSSSLSLFHIDTIASFMTRFIPV